MKTKSFMTRLFIWQTWAKPWVFYQHRLYQPWQRNWLVVVLPMGGFCKWFKLTLRGSVTNKAQKQLNDGNVQCAMCNVQCVVCSVQ